LSAPLRLVPKPLGGPARAADPGPPSADLLRDLRARRPAAERWLVETHARRVERLLFRILGDMRLIEDGCQEVFARVFARIDDVREPEALKPFVTAVTVFVAREAIRRRRRHRWLSFFASDELPDMPAGADPEARQGVLAFYRVLDGFDAEERVAFTLRFVEGLELTAVAAACGVSLATIKRKLQRAEAVFVARCKRDEVLSAWLEEGDRWA
jgi:RNA polymerase sigma-70 factor (ECF subfamily)